jgi:hypothetical protein
VHMCNVLFVELPSRAHSKGVKNAVHRSISCITAQVKQSYCCDSLKCPTEATRKHSGLSSSHSTACVQPDDVALLI